MKIILIVLVLVFNCNIVWGGKETKDSIGTTILKSEINTWQIKELFKEIKLLKDRIDELEKADLNTIYLECKNHNVCFHNIIDASDYIKKIENLGKENNKNK